MYLRDDKAPETTIGLIAWVAMMVINLVTKFPSLTYKYLLDSLYSLNRCRL